MIGFLKAPQAQPVTLALDEINARYRYWRVHIMFGLYGGYGVLYLMRKSLNHVMPAIVADQGLAIADVGLLGSLFYGVYGCSKLVSGLVSDQSNPRYFMALGLLVSALVNILSAFSGSVVSLSLLVVAGALFHGWGWPPCARLLTSWYSQSERGFWWACWNTNSNVGGALAALLVAYLAASGDWQQVLLVTGFLGVLAAALVCWRLRDRPVTLGLPSVGEWRQDRLEQLQEHTETNLRYREVLTTYVFRNRYIWLLAMSYVLVYIVRIAISDWGSLYFTQKYHYDLASANAILFIFEIGGFFGSLVAGWGSDKLFGGNRGPMSLLFAMGIFLSVIAVWLMPVSGFAFQGIGLFILGFCVFGPQMLIGMAAAECSHKAAAGASTGFIGLFAYLGAALAGYPTALVIEQYQWRGFFILLAMASAVISLLLLPFFHAQAASQEAV